MTHKTEVVDGVHFVGIGLGKALGVCALCAAVVSDDGRPQHAWWHRNVIHDISRAEDSEPES
jgi:hypothetical protein